MKYEFHPEDYRFKQIKYFPELAPAFGNGLVYIKIVCIGDEKMYGRLVYWYKACYKIGMPHGDDRWQIVSGSYDFSRGIQTENDYPRIVYSGLISSHEFAEQLLINLLGTLQNESVPVEGKERYEQELYPVITKQQ